MQPAVTTRFDNEKSRKNAYASVCYKIFRPLKGVLNPDGCPGQLGLFFGVEQCKKRFLLWNHGLVAAMAYNYIQQERGKG